MIDQAPLIDSLVDELFELLFARAGGPALSSRMALAPLAEASHFIAAPRPAMTRAEMERPDAEGLMAEVARVLDDLAPDVRAEALAKIAALADALADTADEAAEPSSLIYALH